MPSLKNDNTHHQDFFEHLVAFRNNSHPVASAHLYRLKRFLAYLAYLEEKQIDLPSVTEVIIKDFCKINGISQLTYVKYLTTLGIYYDYSQIT